MGKTREFGDFDFVPKIYNDCSAFQDSDDFVDFSSSGHSQVIDWNAFEDEQKDGYSWAAFRNQQATKAHHGKEVWQSHKTHEINETPGTPKIHHVPLATSKRTDASGHSQDSNHFHADRFTKPPEVNFPRMFSFHIC